MIQLKQQSEQYVRKGIRHIPIVDQNNHVVGIISDRDVRDASPSYSR